MPEPHPSLSEDNLLTAARRLLQAVRIDEAHGGLLSLETVKASEWLARHVESETRRLKREADAAGETK